jgi:hypothetical protein
MTKQLVEAIGQATIMIHSLLLGPLALLAFSLSPAPFPSFLAETKQDPRTFLHAF